MWISPQFLPRTVAGRRDACHTDRTPEPEHGGMWEFDHIRQPLWQKPQVVSGPMNDAA